MIKAETNNQNIVIDDDTIILKKVNSVFASRIAENYQDKLSEMFSIVYSEKHNINIVFVEFERATSDNVKYFNDFISSKLKDKNKTYVFDFSEALFMDSTFLGSIIMLQRAFKTSGGKLFLIINHHKIKIISFFRDISKVLNVYPSLEVLINNLD